MIDALDAFETDLLAGDVATRVLEMWSGGRVHAEVETDVAVAASADTRALLGVAPDTPLGFRRVRLMCGEIVLSQADNWFVPERLTAAMRAALAESDTPFGVIIAPLGPWRETLARERLAGDPMLKVRALVQAQDGTPLAEVIENYSSAVIRQDQRKRRRG